jgi:hypothetical protein
MSSSSPWEASTSTCRLCLDDDDDDDDDGDDDGGCDDDDDDDDNDDDDEGVDTFLLCCSRLGIAPGTYYVVIEPLGSFSLYPSLTSYVMMMKMIMMMMVMMMQMITMMMMMMTLPFSAAASRLRPGRTMSSSSPWEASTSTCYLRHDDDDDGGDDDGDDDDDDDDDDDGDDDDENTVSLCCSRLAIAPGTYYVVIEALGSFNFYSSLASPTSLTVRPVMMDDDDHEGYRHDDPTRVEMMVAILGTYYVVIEALGSFSVYPSASPTSLTVRPVMITMMMMVRMVMMMMMMMMATMVVSLVTGRTMSSSSPWEASPSTRHWCYPPR